MNLFEIIKLSIINCMRKLCDVWGYYKLMKYRHLQSEPLKDCYIEYGFNLFLYETVRKLRPKKVLEIGYGNETNIISQALKDNGFGELHSICISSYWFDIIKKQLPHENCHLIRSSLSIVDYEDKKVFRHSNIPEMDYDIVIVHSPPIKGDVKITIDPMFLKFKCLIIKGRKINSMFFKERLRGFIFKRKWLLYCFVYMKKDNAKNEAMLVLAD